MPIMSVNYVKDGAHAYLGNHAELPSGSSWLLFQFPLFSGIYAATSFIPIFKSGLLSHTFVIVIVAVVDVCGGGVLCGGHLQSSAQESQCSLTKQINGLIWKPKYAMLVPNWPMPYQQFSWITRDVFNQQNLVYILCNYFGIICLATCRQKYLFFLLMCQKCMKNI